MWIVSLDLLFGALETRKKWNFFRKDHLAHNYCTVHFFAKVLRLAKNLSPTNNQGKKWTFCANVDLTGGEAISYLSLLQKYPPLPLLVSNENIKRSFSNHYPFCFIRSFLGSANFPLWFHKRPVKSFVNKNVLAAGGKKTLLQREFLQRLSFSM